MRNKLLEHRLRFGYKFAKDFVKYLEVPYRSYIGWENNETQISVKWLMHIFKKLKLLDENLHMEDLIEW